ncbi:hypothetical protein ACFXKY_12270 [Streptomyces canus]|uniref:hypothetical protein n=1 Tax=Streptomyces canus TaxID=58343 RepID=UPI00367447AA
MFALSQLPRSSRIVQAGDFVQDAPGEGHPLVAYESDEPAKAFFIVKGPLIWLDEDARADSARHSSAVA